MDAAFRAARAGQAGDASTATAETIADGIAVRVAVPEAVTDMMGVVDDVVAVDDAAVVRAMRLVHQHVGVVTEPAGAAGVAALLSHPELANGAVATVLCGGNVTPQQIGRWLASGGTAIDD
jgi:threonine dehydratase